jgi:hypothetical protein
MRKDLTIIYLTLNLMPDAWVDFQLEHLKKAADGCPIISISRNPMDLGTNLIQSEPRSYWNIYMQILRGALVAKTPFVAVAEDDTLYTKEHFQTFRPPMDTVSYNRSRWSLFSWDNMYCLRQRFNNSTMIGPRELVIEALTERKNRWPEGRPDRNVGEIGRPKIDRGLRVTPRKHIEWYSRNPVIQLNHPLGTDIGYTRDASGRVLIKKHGQITAYDIPYWGKATDILDYYKGG